MNKSKNYGHVRALNYASKEALKDYLGKRYSTVASHINRTKLFIDFCKKNNVKKAENITNEFLEDYADSLLSKLAKQDISIVYAHNLLSSANVLMSAFRRDNEVWVSPLEYFGPRSNIRTVAPNMNLLDAKSACREISALGEHEIAMLIWLALILGLRLREAILIDAEKAYKQAVKLGHVDIRKGTKGGRGKRVERLIPGDKRIIKALDVARKLQQKKASFISENEKMITFYREVHRVALPILKRHGIQKIHELRAVLPVSNLKS